MRLRLFVSQLVLGSHGVLHPGQSRPPRIVSTFTSQPYAGRYLAKRCGRFAPEKLAGGKDPVSSNNVPGTGGGFPSLSQTTGMVNLVVVTAVNVGGDKKPGSGQKNKEYSLSTPSHPRAATIPKRKQSVAFS